MQKIKHECDYGFLEYRLPNIPEVLELYAKMGIGNSGSDLEKNSYYITSKAIAHMGFLVEEVSLVVNEKEIKKYEDMLNQPKLLPALCEVAARVLEALNGGSEEKKTS